MRTLSFMAFQFAPYPTLPPQFCSILENQKVEFRMKTSSLAAPRVGGRGQSRNGVSSEPCSLKDCLQSCLLFDRPSSPSAHF